MPFPSALREPSEAGSTEATDEMLMTRPGSAFVESFARRSVSPAVTVVLLGQYVWNDTLKEKPTIEDAFDIHSEHIVPAFLLREVVIGSTPSNPRVVDQDMELAFSLLEFRDECVASCL